MSTPDGRSANTMLVSIVGREQLALAARRRSVNPCPTADLGRSGGALVDGVQAIQHRA
jgi:hypothetical protein